MSDVQKDLISNAEVALERAANRPPVYDRIGPSLAVDQPTILGMAQQIIDLQDALGAIVALLKMEGSTGAGAR